MARLNNIDIAVLQKANELAARYGFRPTELVITFGLEEPDHGDHSLRYESPPADEKSRDFDNMLFSIGIQDTSGVKEQPTLRGTDEQIFAALEAAIRAAPRSRAR